MGSGGMLALSVDRPAVRRLNVQRQELAGAIVVVGMRAKRRDIRVTDV